MNIVIGALAIGLGCSAALGSTTIDTMSDEQLRNMVLDLKGEVDSLRAEQNTDWLTEQRAEQVRGLVADVLADADTRSSLQGSGTLAGYDKGFFIGSADGNWKLKINYQLQVRWAYNDAGNQANAHGFEIRRNKLKFSGNVVDPSWGYKLSIVTDRQSVIGDSANVFLENAFISKKMDNGWYLNIGQMKAPFLREELVSSTKQLAVDRSMVNNAFSWTYTQGALLGWKNDTLKIEGMYNDGPNHLNQQASTANGVQGLNARVEMLLGGDSDWGMFKGFNAKNTNGKTGFMLGAALGWFNGGLGQVQEYGNARVAQSTAWTVDASVAGDGWTLFTYFAWSDGKDRYIQPQSAANPNNRQKQKAWGWVVQGGYLMAEDVELFARYSLGETKGSDALTGRTIDPGNKDNSALTLGMNWFINSNVKFTMDWGYAFNPVYNGNPQAPNAPTPYSPDYTSSGTGWRADANNARRTQVEDGQWLLRAQLQLTF